MLVQLHLSRGHCVLLERPAGCPESLTAGIRSRQPFAEAESRLGWSVIPATIPAGGGLLLKDKVEAAFSNPMLTALMLFITAILLTLSEVFSKRRAKPGTDLAGQPHHRRVSGCFNFPGISLWCHHLWRALPGSRQDAARFSFLLAIPIMTAAGVLALKDLLAVPGWRLLPVVLIGFVASGLIGYFVIRWFLNFLKTKSLLPFAPTRAARGGRLVDIGVR